MSQAGEKDEWSALLDSQERELLKMSDADLIEGEDIGALRSEKLALLAAARTEAARRRLATAKAGVALKAAAQETKAEVIDIQKARAFVQVAMNDPRCTLAARKMDEMSDEDVLRIYQQLKQLQPDGGA
jgi:ligand-binding sensor domain-containing protein